MGQVVGAEEDRRSNARRALPGIAARALLAGALALVAAAPAAAQTIPASTTIQVIPPPGIDGPPPSGTVSVELDGRRVASLPLERGIVPLPLVTGALSLTGRTVTVRYSGDNFYDPSGGVTVTFPPTSGLGIVARPIDKLAPVVMLGAPTAGARYRRGDRVLASYSCSDVGGTAGGVARCDGSVPAGQPIDTGSTGMRSFRIDTRDAAGNADTRIIEYEVVDRPAAGGSARRPTSPPPPSPPPLPRPQIQVPDLGAVIPQELAPAPPSTSTASGEPSDDEPAAASPAPAPDATPSATASAAPPPAEPGAEREPEEEHELQPYDPKSEPGKVVGIMVAAFTLLQLGAVRGGLAAAGSGAVIGAVGSRHGSERSRHRDAGSAGGAGGRGAADSTPELEMGYEGVDVEQIADSRETVKAGDRSRTWGWPGTALVDAASVAVPVALAARTPLLARVTSDGSYLRAMLGTVAIVPLLAGMALGVLAVDDTGGDALAPALALTMAIAVLGIFDAAAGFAAVLTFVVGVGLLGGIDSAPAVRTLMGLAALWFVVPVLAGAARPLRRPPPEWLEETWDRAADFIIASLIGAWAVHQIVLALPGLAGMELPIADHANLLAGTVLVALFARLSAETIASHLYPARLSSATPSELPDPALVTQLGAILLRSGIFIFLAIVVVGHSWQLWVALALFVIPQLLALFEDSIPNSPALFSALPKGLVELVLMLLVGTAIGALLLTVMDENAESFLATSIVILSLPGFVLALLGLVGRDGPEREFGWPTRFAGVGLLVLGVMLVFGLIL